MKLIKEAKRLQELAGINEIKVEPPKREEYYIYNLDDSEGTEPPLGPFSLNKAKEKLNWSPKISFNQLVKEMVHEDFKIAKNDQLINK